VWAATSPQLDGIGGVYCEDGDIAELVLADATTPGGVREYAVDADQGQLDYGLCRQSSQALTPSVENRAAPRDRSVASSTYRRPVTRQPHG
jgi:hypothetical protein